MLLSLPRPPLPSLTPLIECVAAARRLVVLTGAGCSTESGIPDYRSPRTTPRTAPMRYVEFTRSAEKRQRYWARAVVGWAHVGQARPNAAHHALAALEAQGKISTCITQNVDGLHQAAGSARVIELHGALGEVICLDCEQVTARRDLQTRMQALNPGWLNDAAVINPDGDAQHQPRSKLLRGAGLPGLRWGAQAEGGVLWRAGTAAPRGAGLRSGG